MDINNTTENAFEIAEFPNNQISNDFYVVSKLKFYALFLSSFGIYIIYWFFKNWKLQKNLTGEPCWPAMRGIFLIFFTHDLFKRVDKKLKTSSKKYNWNHENQATLVLALVIISNILSKVSEKNIGVPYTNIAFLIFMPITGIALARAQRAINFACNDPEGGSNDNLTGLNIFWIVIGSIFTILILIGTFLPQE